MKSNEQFFVCLKLIVINEPDLCGLNMVADLHMVVDLHMLAVLNLLAHLTFDA